MTAAAKVGIFMLVILAVLGFFILKIEEIKIGRGSSTRKIIAEFDSVAGLDPKATVRVAGVRKGKVTDIILTDAGMARVTMEVDSDVKLRQGAVARVANLGLLGEKYIELDPGPPKAPQLTETETLVLKGTQPASMDDVTNQVATIAEDVKAITASLRKSMSGPTGEQRLEDIVENVRAITSQVRLIIEANRMNIDVTASNFRKITDDLRVEIPRIAASIDRVANSFGGTVGENREDLRAIVSNLKTLSADLKTTATNVNSITGQVKSGEGTMGKLIYDDEAYKRLNNTLSSVESGVTELKNTLGRVGKIELDLGLKADYLLGSNDDEFPFEGRTRSGVTVALRPNPDLNRFYNIELMDDPMGQRNEKVTETTTTDNTGASTTVTTRQVRYDRDFLVSAQAGWHLKQFDLRLGLFDSVGGIGADVNLGERLKVTGEAFDFGGRYDDQPHFRVRGQYVLRREKKDFPLVFVSTGIDNPLNDSSFIFGGGIRWRDDDLKYLLGSIPTN